MLRYMIYEMVITWDYSMTTDFSSSAHTPYLLSQYILSIGLTVVASIHLLLAATIDAPALPLEPD